MAKSLSLSGFFEDSKYPRRILAIGAIVLLLLQLGIFIAFCNQSGLKSRVCVFDSAGRKIYESTGPTLSSYEKMVFESNFGPLGNYITQLQSEMAPFNYRAWILLAVGIPLGLILMLFFMAQVWLILLNGNPKEEAPDESELAKTRFTSLLSFSKNFSTLGIGFVIAVSMLILWLIPSFIGDVAKLLLNAVKDYPWFFLGAFAFIGGLLVWIIYLKYKLSKTMLENRMEIEKYRLKAQLLDNGSVPQLLIAPTDADENRPLSQSGEH